jgi:phenylacetate-coenzyme A ligase PaaK-like adenylate-forming protein
LAKPPLKVVVEAVDLDNVGNLKQELEEAIRAKLIIPAKVTLVPPAVLPRSEMKTQLLVKLYEGKPEWLL